MQYSYSQGSEVCSKLLSVSILYFLKAGFGNSKCPNPQGRKYAQNFIALKSSLGLVLTTTVGLYACEPAQDIHLEPFL